MVESNERQSVGDRTNPPPVHLAAQILLVAVLYFLAGQASFSLSVSHGIVTMVVFMAEGISLAAAILWSPRIWPGIFIGQFALATYNGLGWPLAVAISGINSAEAVIGVLLFRRLRIGHTLERLRDIGLLLALIILVLQPFSASCGTLALWLGGRLTTDGLEAAWMSWWLGNSIGQIVIAPLLLALAALELRRGAALRALLIPLLLSLACGWMAFRGPQIIDITLGLVLAEPLMIIIAARFGLAGATLATAVMTFLTLFYTHLGTGPFAARLELATMNFFLLRLALIGQFTAVLFAERRQDMRVLQLNRDQLNLAQRIANLGSWSLDMRTHRLEWSDELYRIFEFDAAALQPDYDAFLSRAHPDDRQRISATFDAAVAKRTSYECTHRLWFPDGRIKHVRVRGEVRYARDGKPLNFIGTLLDITALTEAERQLQLYAHLFEQSGEAIIVSDAANNIVTVNPAFTRLTGYTIAEVIGRNPRVLASGKTPPETYPALWRALTEHGHWRGELWDKRKDGTVYPKWASISVIRDANGVLTNYTASFIDIGERKAAEERIAKLAHHDALTGLHNRFSLQLRFEQALLTAHRENTRLAVMFFDMDRFKHINDTLGHHIGDLLLIEVAGRLTSNARASDIVARLGGDEFIMVLTGLGDNAYAVVEPLASKISQRLAQPYLLDGQTLHSNGSIGISLYPDDGGDVETLMRHADIAMYHAKESGRGQFKRYSPAMTASTSLRQALEADLRQALEGEAFELHYQPQVQIGDNRVYRLEALARWRHSELGWVSPLLFIPIIEKLGLAESFGAWVIEEACRQLAQWRTCNVGEARVAVNLSAGQLRSPMLLHQTSAAMSCHGIRAGELEFEVSEDMLLDQPERIAEQFSALHALGIELAIGNFGSGLASLTYLRQLPIRTLKLARSVVAGIDSETGRDSNAIVAAILALAHTLSLRVVAEGVETEAQRAFLRDQRCDLLQGYLVSVPLDEAEAARFMRDN